MNDQATLEQIEAKYQYDFPDIFKQLWLDGMMDWYKGWDEPWTSEKNWYTEIYPKIKDKPPLLLHTGGYDFEMGRLEDILNFSQPQNLPQNQQFIPFAQTGAGDQYGFYISQDNQHQSPIVLLVHDDQKIIFLSKNLEDFIVYMMLTRVADIVEDEIEDDFGGKFEAFRIGILADLNTIKKYINPAYTKLLQGIYNREVKKQCELLPIEEYKLLLQTHLMFDLFDQEFSLS